MLWITGVRPCRVHLRRQENAVRLVADRRLAYIHRALQLAVIVYIGVIEICLWHRYAVFETPAAHVNAYPSACVPHAKTGPPDYYSNPSLDWGLNLSGTDLAITGGYSFGPNSSCLPFVPERDVAVTRSGLPHTLWRRALSNRRYHLSRSPRLRPLQL